MDKAREAWIEHLTLAGEDAYMSISGSRSIPLDIEQMIHIIAVMIEENNNAHS